MSATPQPRSPALALRPRPRTAAARLAAAALAATALLLVGGCTEEEEEGAEPRCGDRRVDAGETPATCCVDAGCDTGVCDLAAMRCVDPWTLSCPFITGDCADTRPWLCDGDTPSYDCSGCGCPGDARCLESVCYAPEVVALQRSSPGIPEDLPTGDYFAFIDAMASGDAMTYAELVQELDARLREDGRRVALLLGESHNSLDEQAVGLQIIRDLVDRGWGITEIGIEGDPPILDVSPLGALASLSFDIDGDFTNVAYCDAAVPRTVGRLNDDGIYVQYTGSGHTSQEICHHPELWSICDLPHTAECILAEGRRSLTVILFDPHVWLWLSDRVLLWRLGDAYPDPAAVSAELEASLQRWRLSMDAQVAAPAYEAVVEGRDVNVRVLPAPHTQDVFFAYFPRPGRPAYLMEAFGALWGDADAQAFLLAHDIRPAYCSISWDLTPGTEAMWLYCGRNGYELEATVDATELTLESWTDVTP